VIKHDPLVTYSYTWESSEDGYNWQQLPSSTQTATISAPCVDGEVIFVKVIVHGQDGFSEIRIVTTAASSDQDQPCAQLHLTPVNGLVLKDASTPYSRTRTLSVSGISDCPEKAYLQVARADGRIITRFQLSSLELSGTAMQVEVDGSGLYTATLVECGSPRTLKFITR